MTVKSAHQFLYNQLLINYEAGEADSIAKLVTEHCCGLSFGQLKQHADQLLTPLQQQQVVACLKELATNKPVQYVLGEAWFYNMPFYVDENVLIPRPETEELVQWIAKEHDQQTELNIIEIGTGSGCIAVALKKALPRATITAVDISKNALEVARRNALALQVNVDFLLLDFLNEAEWSQLPACNLLVSNPPYIPLSEKAKLDAHVTEWEPSTALFVPENDALLFYRKIALFGQQHLATGNEIYVECHQNFARTTSDMFLQNGYETILCKDIFDNDRMVKATRF